jgi:HD-like signal output (HDOD) protein
MEIVLPAQLPVLVRIVDALSDPCATARTVARTLSPTPELSHCLVRLANTFGRRGRASNIQEALSELGPQAAKHLVFCLGAKKQLTSHSSNGVPIEAFWLGSLRRAVACHVIGRALGEGADLSLFALGFYQDMALLLRAQQDPSAARALRSVESTARRLHRERSRGMAHDELGLTLCTQLGLPDNIAVPVRYHHQPEQAPLEFQTYARIACAAESLADLAITREPLSVSSRAEHELEQLNLEGMLPSLFDQQGDLVEDTAEAFGIEAVPEKRFVDVKHEIDVRSSGVQAADSSLLRELSELRRHNELLKERIRRISGGVIELRPDPRSEEVRLDQEAERQSG